MLAVYTRHAADCAKVKDKDWRRCRCPKWVSGTHAEELIRKSAKTRSWEKAEEYRRQLEGTSSSTPVREDESFRTAAMAPSGRHRDQKKSPGTIETAVGRRFEFAGSRVSEISVAKFAEKSAFRVRHDPFQGGAVCHVPIC